MTIRRNWRWRRRAAGAVTGLAVLLSATAGRAQITLDGSLGTAGTLTGPNFVISSGVGRIVGNNLFQSFGLFNVQNGESATFTGPASIANVISRVTGGQLSTIDGLIDTRTWMPSANFFLLNPSGVMFGPGAALNVGGSFHVSTADYLRFTDGAQFFARLSPASTLTVAAPAAFGFLTANPAPVSLEGSVLTVDPGQTLSIVGGPVTIHGATLLAPGGQVQIAAAAAAGEMPIGNVGAGSVPQLGPVEISGGSFVDATGDPGGTVMIRAGRLVIDGSVVSTGTLGDADPPTTVGIDILAQDEFVLSGGGLVQTAAFAGGRGGDVLIAAGSGQGDGSIQVSGGSVVLSLTGGRGRGGDVRLTAGHVGVDDAVIGTVSQLGEGAGGNVTVDGGVVTLTGGASIQSINQNTTLDGRGGDITIRATDSVLISGQNASSSASQLISTTDTAGNGGAILVSAPSLTMEAGTAITSTTSFAGDGVGGAGGNIVIDVGHLSLTGGATINSVNSVTSVDSAIAPRTPDVSFLPGTVTVTATGEADISGTNGGIFSIGLGAPPGDITVQAGTLHLTDGALIQGGSFAGESEGGNVTVRASDSILIAGGAGISSQAFNLDVGRIAVAAPTLTIDDGFINTGTLGVGRAGDIAIDVGTLTLTNGAQIASSNIFTASGSGGTITVNAAESVTISGSSPNGQPVLPEPFKGFIQDTASGIFSTASSDNPVAGPAGSIIVSSPTITLTDGGKLSVATTGAGAAGNIQIGTGALTVARGARIDSSTSASGHGGSIGVAASQSVTISDADSGLFSTASSQDPLAGSAGSITVSAPSLAVSGGGRISVATTGPGAAGDVQIDAGTMTVAGGARIDSSTSGSGHGGNIGVTGSQSVTISDADSGLFSTASSQDPLAGSAGSISVSTPRLALGEGGRISVATTGPGAAGDIRIDAGTMTVASGARIDSSTSGAGHGGSIGVTGSQSVAISDTGSGLFSTASSQDPLAGSAGSISVSTPNLTVSGGGNVSVATTGPGAAGDIRIDAGSMTVASGARIDSSTSGSGHGGVITVNTSGGLLTIDGAGLFSDASGTGAGGDITLTANQIDLLDGAAISATSTGTADALAGSINVTFGDSLTMRNSSITTNAAVADGGNISIASTGSLLYLVDSQITTSVRSGVGSGGNITIGSSGHPLEFVVLNDGGIHADAFGGPGGNINIFADILLSSTAIDTTITASSQLSQPGTVNISAVVTNLSGVLAELPSDMLKVTALLRASCAARLAEGKASSLVIAGREGVPLEPAGLLPSALVEPRLTAGTPGAAQFLSTDFPALRLTYLDPKCGR